MQFSVDETQFHSLSDVPSDFFNFHASIDVCQLAKAKAIRGISRIKEAVDNYCFVFCFEGSSDCRVQLKVIDEAPRVVVLVIQGRF